MAILLNRKNLEVSRNADVPVLNGRRLALGRCSEFLKDAFRAFKRSIVERWEGSFWLPLESGRLKNIIISFQQYLGHGTLIEMCILCINPTF